MSKNIRHLRMCFQPSMDVFGIFLTQQLRRTLKNFECRSSLINYIEPDFGGFIKPVVEQRYILL